MTKIDLTKLTVSSKQFHGYKLHDPHPSSIMFYGAVNDQSTEVLRISKDGVWANPDVPVDEIAKKVLDAMDNNIKQMVDRVRSEEREACAKVCDEATLRFHALWEKFEYSEDQLMSIAASQCAAAIRESGRT